MTGLDLQLELFQRGVEMTEWQDLSGRSILVVEDDYSQAANTASFLRIAGATVLGPCATEEASYRQIDRQLPTAAVLELNLGGGPRFEIARKLERRGVPFIFLTGHEHQVIPDDFSAIAVLQKPVSARHLVQAVSLLPIMAYRPKEP